MCGTHSSATGENVSGCVECVPHKQNKSISICTACAFALKQLFFFLPQREKEKIRLMEKSRPDQVRPARSADSAAGQGQTNDSGYGKDIKGKW
jgi:hypothetical protein